ncbi:MAG: dTDP-4-dehydrorhamnose reductase [Proteobacteria bacterium]|nr:dTDP-4-dehydrorhamnose reductase [Pseudomonadota bacterium]
MRLLIAGWQGQLARSLVEIAPGISDIEALAVGRPALDICEPATITRAMTDFKPDIIINAAAYTAVDKAESEPAAAFALNRDGARLLAEAAARRGAAIIHVSTDYVFDGSKPEPYVETDPTGPLGVYGRSKLEGEEAVRAANPRHLILRTSWVHSPGGANFVRTMLRLGAERDTLRVVDDQIGAPTYAPHLAAAILELARHFQRSPSETRWGTYHAAGTGYVTWCGFAREIFKLSALRGGRSPRVEAITTADYPTPARRPANSRLASDLLASTFGVRLPPWQIGLEECIQRLMP